MANVLLTGQMIAFEALRSLEQRPLPIRLPLVKGPARYGDHVSVPLPQSFRRNGPLRFTVQYRYVVLTREVHHRPLPSLDLVLTLDRFSDQYLREWADLTARCLMRYPRIVVAQQEIPQAIEQAFQVSDTGENLALLFCRAYDPQADGFRMYFDLLYGIVE